MKELPAFKRRNYDDVHAFIGEMLTGEAGNGESQLISLSEQNDGHFRALFHPAYFRLQAGQFEPSKSQWNTLKKKLKRHNAAIFVFKEHGEVNINGKAYYLDFGFLPELTDRH